MNEIWTEKYRPKDFSDIFGQEAIVKSVSNFIKNRNMPHLLFVGPAGVGKTSLALIIAKSLFGDEWNQNFLELNASDERGIDVIRIKVKDFARTKAIGDVPFKIIYLDECDALTKEAQQALRRTMENYTQTCRFILSANYSSKIIEPIQSRCAVFRFKPLDKSKMFEFIEKIAKSEKIKINESAMELLYELSEGDCRKLINTLQSAASISSNIDEDTISYVASFINPKEIRNILLIALSGRFIEARNLLLNAMLNYGLSGNDVIKQIQKEVLELNIEDKVKMMIIERCGEIEFRINEGSDEFIQLESFLAYLCNLGGR